MKTRLLFLLMGMIFLLVSCNPLRMEPLPAEEIAGQPQGLSDALVTTLQALGVPDNIPILPEFEGMSVDEEIISYTTTTSFQTVIAFYRSAMPESGWTEIPALSHTDAEMKNSSLGFETADQKAKISILNQGASILVTIFLSEK